MTNASYDLVDAELARIDDLGLLVSDRDAAERLYRLVGALASLSERHASDPRGRCRLCRRGRWWTRRRTCTVREALTAYGIGQAGTSGRAL
jgi:hypothetical protein